MHNNGVQERQQHDQLYSSAVTYRQETIMHPNGFDAILRIVVDIYFGLTIKGLKLFHNKIHIIKTLL